MFSRTERHLRGKSDVKKYPPSHHQPQPDETRNLLMCDKECSGHFIIKQLLKQLTKNQDHLFVVVKYAEIDWEVFYF